MRIRNIGDLRKYLERSGLSPDAFARECFLSHMTLRRLLKRPDADSIGEKYWPIFDQATSVAIAGPADPLIPEVGAGEFEALRASLLDSGRGPA